MPENWQPTGADSLMLPELFNITVWSRF